MSYDGNVDVEAWELLSFWNREKGEGPTYRIDGAGKERAKPRPVSRHHPGKGDGFGVYVLIMPLCPWDVKDTLGIVVRRGDGEVIPKNVSIEFGMLVTSVLHSDDVVCDKQVGTRSFCIINMGTFSDNAVVIEQMKKVGSSHESMVESQKEVAMLD